MVYRISGKPFGDNKKTNNAGTGTFLVGKIEKDLKKKMPFGLAIDTAA